MNYCLSLLFCLLGSFSLEFFSKPNPKCFRCRSKLGLVIHALLVLFSYCLLLLVTRRPLFSVGLCLALLTLVMVVNNAKYATLREPLVFSDFFLYLQAVQHPRLYLPFLGILPLILLVCIVFGLTLLGMFIEPANFDWFSLTTVLLLISIISLFHLMYRFCLAIKVTQLKGDCEMFGILATLCIYAIHAFKSRPLLQCKLDENTDYVAQVDELQVKSGKDLVVVQSESFFDARRLSPKIKTEILSEYDQCLNQCDYHGLLDVPAWGANTMRTEFAFLTGLRVDQIGLAQFYPYRQLLGVKVPSIVGALKTSGYHCVCIHPHAASFFMRDKFFEQLGFDEFIDGKQFVGAAREGPYVADSAVTEMIQEVLDRVDRPCFIFAITMENHGPLHLESLEEGEWSKYYSQQPMNGMADLTVYLRHLKNADKMVSQLCQFFSKRERRTVFAFYGDHVPAMSKVFKQLEYGDPRSNYLIWSSCSNVMEEPEGQILKVESLAHKLINLLR